MQKKNLNIICYLLLAFQFSFLPSRATVYNVADKASLLSRMSAALPGDTVIVANGSYDWGQINFVNNNSTAASAWIVLKAQSPAGVEFKGSTYLQFKGTRVEINGFKFSNGSAGTNAVVSFRSSSSNLSNYCRVTNITFDNYNTYSADSTVENEWIGIYGTRNRVDHCSFINKYNARATVVVWYSSTTYPAPAIATFHLIDSNYFQGRSFQGANGGETIRVGDSNGSRTDGYNTIEYNLFEDCNQVEPEIISNKSDFNTYRYNTFKNCNGGLTLRHGRYCSVYGNFFIVDDPAYTRSYGVRAIDKGHKIYNNYFEGLLGNKNSLTALRCPIILYNGIASTIDTADASKASGYFPADSSIVAFNTIVNCSGGAGIVLGYRGNSTYIYEPLGITVANNLVKMTTGQAAYKDAANTTLTYLAEGNLYSAPSGAGISPSTGFANTTLSFGARENGILPPPAVVTDAAVNAPAYIALLGNLDVQLQQRSALPDVGSDEINGAGAVVNYPLNNLLVGAGTAQSVLPIHFESFKAIKENKNVKLTWAVSGNDAIKMFVVEHSADAVHFSALGTIAASKASAIKQYQFLHNDPGTGNHFYRLKLVGDDGAESYSGVRLVAFKKSVAVNVFPNPVGELLHVEIDGMLPAGATMTITNAEGKVMQKTTALGPVNNIPAHQMARGVYQLRIADKETTIATCTIMKQ